MCCVDFASIFLVLVHFHNFPVQTKVKGDNYNMFLRHADESHYVPECMKPGPSLER